MVANDLMSYAELYKGAVTNLYEKTPAHERFVAHAVREVMNGMAKCKRGITRPQVQYVQLLDKLQSIWDQHRLPKGPEVLALANSTGEENPIASIPTQIVTQIQLLLREHEEGRKRSKDSPYIFFEVFLPNPVSRDAIPEAYTQMWNSLHNWFMAEAHAGGKLPDQQAIDQLESKFKQLESVLLSVADRYSNTISRLDEILDKANT